MRYERHTVTVPGTTDTDIAAALARLAGFPTGTFIGRASDLFGLGNARKAVVVFHRDVMATYGNAVEALAYHGADITVSRMLAPQHDWQPTDEYRIEYDAARVRSALLEEVTADVRR